MVSVLALYYDDPSFSVKFYLKRTKINKRGSGWPSVRNLKFDAVVDQLLPFFLDSRPKFLKLKLRFPVVHELID